MNLRRSTLSVLAASLVFLGCSSTGDPRTASGGEILFGSGKIEENTEALRAQAEERKSLQALAEKENADLEAIRRARAERVAALERDLSSMESRTSELDRLIEQKRRKESVEQARVAELERRATQIHADIERLRRDDGRAAEVRRAEATALEERLDETRRLVEIL